MAIEFEMEYCNTGSQVENEVKKYSYEEVFGHPQPGLAEYKKKKAQDWKIDTEIHVISEGKIGMGDDPRENLRITSGEFDVTKHFEKNIGMGCINPCTELRITDNLVKSITPEVDFDSKEFTEKLKALQYDLERTKDQSSHDNLIDEFTKRASKDIWNSRAVKEKTAEFFNKTWDLTKNRSDKLTDYSDYAEFLDEYFDEGDE